MAANRHVLNIFAVFVFGLPLAANASINLVSNGSFETGDFSGWTVSTFTSIPGQLGVTVINGHTPYGDPAIPNDPFTFGPDPGGTHQAYFVDDAASESISQNVNLTAGKLYEVGFDLFPTISGSHNSGFYSLTGSLGTQVVATVNSSTNVIPVATWTHFSGTFTPSVSGFVPFTFSFLSGAAPAKDVLVDEVYVVQGAVTFTPEPALFGFLGAGLIGLAAARRYLASR